MTQIDAINIMLGAIGEAPVTAIAGVTDPDVVMAVQILDETRRELCLQPWQFNTEYDVEIPYDDTLTWNEPDATTTALYIFLVPSDLVSFKTSQIPEQMGNNHIDMIARQAKQYTTGAPASRPLVFYDRDYNRDGFPQTQRDTIWIDATWDQDDWNYLPHTARRLIAIMAANRFASRAVGSEKLVAFTERDLLLAQRTFLRDQSPPDRRNVLLQPDMWQAMGRRPFSLDRRYAEKTQRRP